MDSGKRRSIPRVRFISTSMWLIAGTYTAKNRIIRTRMLAADIRDDMRAYCEVAGFSPTDQRFEVQRTVCKETKM